MHGVKIGWFIGGAALLLSGCSGLLEAASQDVRALWSNNSPNLQHVILDPARVYLEVQVPGAKALLPLAVEDAVGQKAPVDTWVSASGDVLRTQAGFFTSGQTQPKFWQNVQYSWTALGVPGQVTFDLPVFGLYGVRQQFERLGTVPMNQLSTPMMKRAGQAPGVVFTAWRSVWLNPPARIPNDLKLNALNHVVGVDPRTGIALYGLQCMQADYCVEWLLRTANQNL